MSEAAVRAFSEENNEAGNNDDVHETTSTVKAVYDFNATTVDAMPDLIEYLNRDIDESTSGKLDLRHYKSLYSSGILDDNKNT